MFAFTKIFLLASLAISASAVSVGGHAARSPAHHHAVAARRAAAPVAVANPAMAEQPLGRRVSRKARRQSAKRCRPRTSTVVPTPTPAPVSSTIIASPTSVAVTSSAEATTTSSSSSTEVPTTSTTPAETVTSQATVSSTPEPKPTTSSTPIPETTSRAEPTTSSTPTPEPTTTSTPPAEPTTTSTPPAEPTTTSTPPAEPTTTSTPPPEPTTSTTPAPAPTQGSGPTTGGNHEGDATYFATGLGACGITNLPEDNIVAVPKDMFDNYPDYNRVNPNSNPICNKKIRAFFGGDYLDVAVTDRCEDCVDGDLDFTTGAFAKLFKGKVDGRGRFRWSWHSEIGL